MLTKLTPLKSGLRSRSKALLLDVDGVIIKNQRLLINVATNISKYCAKKLHLSPNEAVRVNNILYNEYGHSYRGLRKAYGIINSLDDFNHAVYDWDVMHQLSQLRDDLPHSLHSQRLRELATVCRIKGFPIYIFSNAPFEWCQMALDVSGLSTYVPTRNIISCDHEVARHLDEDGFKPVKRVYDKLYDYIGFEEHQDTTLVFVEDSFKNLVPVIGTSKWIPVYYNGEIPAHNELQVVTATDIGEVKNLLC